MARPRAALVTLAICGLLAGGSLLTAGGTTGRPHLWLTLSHAKTYSACVSSDCGDWSVTLNWQVPTVPGATGYNLLACQGTNCTPTRQGTASASPFTFRGLDCGAAYTLEVQAHNSGGTGIGPMWPTSYSTPTCPSNGTGSTDFNGLSTDPSFFPISVYFQGTANASTYQSVGVNTFLTPDVYSNAELATLKAAGMIVVECSTLGNPGSTYTGADGSTYTNYAPTTCSRDARNDSNASIIRGWYDLPDEVDTAQQTGSSSYGPCIAPSSVQSQSTAITAGDNANPTRAVIVSFNSAPAVNTTSRGGFCHYHIEHYPQYLQGATGATYDVYPMNYGYPIDSSGWGVYNLHAWFKAAGQDKPVFPVIETTPIHTGAGSPTAAQLHYEVWNSIVLGANGIQYFCDIISPSFNEAGCLSIPSIESQMSADDAQIKSLGSVLNSASLTSDQPTVSASFLVNTMTKRPGDGYEYLFSDADDATGGSATFTVPGGGSGTVTVVGESRTVTMTNGQFADSFGGCSSSTCSATAVHIYKIPYSSFTCPSGVRCFYVASNGSDSNNGTSESTPWAHAPGMRTFTGAYTHQAGDEFIFRGGDTWGNSNFPLAPAAGGNSSHTDLYGVDKTWYSGTSWTQPTFDAQSANITGTDGHASGAQDIFFDLRATDYVTVDNIAFKNWTASSISGYGNCAVVELDGDSHVTIDHVTVTGINIDASGDAQNASCAVAFGDTQSPWDGNSILENSTITGDGATYGLGAWAIPNAENNTMSGLPGFIYPAGSGTISGNLLYDCSYPTIPVGASNLHSDMILINDQGDPSSTFYIHDNVLHDTGYFGSSAECESLWVNNPGETDYVWNNVIYNLHGTGSLKLGDDSTTNGTAYVWNNTLAGAQDNADPCIEAGHGTMTAVTIENNLCVSDSGSAVSGLTGTIDHNTLLTTAQMTSDVAQSSGLFATSPYQWLETGNPAPTSGAGVSLAADCTGALTSLCSDTTYAGERPTVPRPGSNGWDVGAYQEP